MRNARAIHLKANFGAYCKFHLWWRRSPSSCWSPSTVGSLDPGHHAGRAGEGHQVLARVPAQVGSHDHAGVGNQRHCERTRVARACETAGARPHHAGNWSNPTNVLLYGLVPKWMDECGPARRHESHGYLLCASRLFPQNRIQNIGVLQPAWCLQVSFVFKNEEIDEEVNHLYRLVRRKQLMWLLPTAFCRKMFVSSLGSARIYVHLQGFVYIATDILRTYFPIFSQHFELQTMPMENCLSVDWNRCESHALRMQNSHT